MGSDTIESGVKGDATLFLHNWKSGLARAYSNAIQSIMIVGFRHKGLEAFFHTGSTRGVQPTHTKRLAAILALLDVAESTADLNQPALRLHALRGNLRGHWSVRVSGNWRVTFRFVRTDVELVDYQDYH